MVYTILVLSLSDYNRKSPKSAKNFFKYVLETFKIEEFLFFKKVLYLKCLLKPKQHLFASGILRLISKLTFLLLLVVSK